MEAKDRIICALDVDNAHRALELAGQLRGHVGVLKIGLELLTTAGIEIMGRLHEAGDTPLFLDAKLHDIPNTITGAMRGVARLGAWCVTVHALGGPAMLTAATEAARREAEWAGVPPPKVFAVTVLTSMSAAMLRDNLRVTISLPEYVAHLATMAAECGCDGVIASPQEIAVVRAAVTTPGFRIVTPGVRPAGSEKGDQARTMTPAEAISAGADYLVIGRPITSAREPAAEADQIAAEIEMALQMAPQ